MEDDDYNDYDDDNDDDDDDDDDDDEICVEPTKVIIVCLTMWSLGMYITMFRLHTASILQEMRSTGYVVTL